MPKETTPTTNSHETKKRKLAYDMEFREMLRANPGIIRTAIALVDKAIAKYNPPNVMVGKTELRYDIESGQWLQQRRPALVRDGKMVLDEKGEIVTTPGEWVPMKFLRGGSILAPAEPIVDKATGLEISVIGRSNRRFFVGLHGGTERVDKCDYLRLNLHGHSFFIKRSFITTNPGFVEFKNTVKAEELLKDLDFVKVVEAKLGYQDKNESWYISKWEDLESAGFASYEDGIMASFDDYGKIVRLPSSAEGQFSEPESRENPIWSKIKYKLIRDRLKPADLHNDLYANLFYNPQTKTFVLLDVTGGEDSEMLGKALIESR